MPVQKILLISPALDDKGGVASFCRLLVENIGPGFRVDHFPIGNRPGNTNVVKRIFFFLEDVVRLRRKLASSDFGLVVLNPSFRILSLLRDTFFLARMKESRDRSIVVMFHGWDEALAQKIANNSLLKSRFRRGYQKASLILVLCQDFQSRLEGLGIPAEKIRIVTTMYQRMQPAPGSLECGPKEKKGILFVGKLTKSKGVFIVADTARLLAESGIKNFRVVIAGDGPEKAGLRRYAQEHGLENVLEIPGHVLGESKWALYDENEIFLFPSSSEGCPLVVLEAMGAGLAIVSRPVGAIPDIVKDHENGFVINSLKSEDFFRMVKTYFFIKYF